MNTNIELLDNREKTKMAEAAVNHIGNCVRPMLDENMKEQMDAAAFILAEVRHAASEAALMISDGKRREQKKADILERLWHTLITDGCDEE